MENLEIIENVMDQHRVLADQIGAVYTTVSDKDALMKLDKAQASLAADLRQPLAKRRANLIESLNLLETALKNHYDFEEKMLPPLLGELLTKALIIEHKSLINDMAKVISEISNINLNGLDRPAERRQEAAMSELLTVARDKKLDHQKREEATLLTLQYICEEKAANR